MLRILNLNRLILRSGVVWAVVLSARFSDMRRFEGTCQCHLSVHDKAVRLDLSYQLKFVTKFFKTRSSVKALCQYTILSSRSLAITNHVRTHAHTHTHTYIHTYIPITAHKMRTFVNSVYFTWTQFVNY